jgi:hypothetical protein
MSDVENGVLALVQSYVSKKATLKSELYHDLHIHGDDAGELLEAVYKQYGTTFYDMKFSAYFPNHAEGLPRIIKWMGFKDKKVGSFTVSHLVTCVEAGRWFEPGRSS